MKKARANGNGDGTIYEYRKGKFRAQIHQNGKRKSQTFRTKNEAKQWLRDQAVIAKELNDQPPLSTPSERQQQNTPKRLRDWVEECLKKLEHQLRPNTFRDYKRYANDLIVEELGEISLRSLRRKQINEFYQNLLVEGYGVPTVQYVHRVLHRILEIAISEDEIEANPAHKALVPKSGEQKEMKILNEQQVLVFLAAVKGHLREALYQIAFKLGARESEILGLRWTDVDLFEGVIYIRYQAKRVTGDGLKLRQVKTKASRRAIKMGEHLETLLRQHKIRQDEWVLEKRREAAAKNIEFRWEDNDLVFPAVTGTIFDQSNLVAEFKGILELTNLPEIRFHDTRHTAASIMLKYTKDVLIVSRTLGHSRPSTTLNIYAHLLPGMESQAAQVIDTALTPLPANGFPVSEIGKAKLIEIAGGMSLAWARKKPKNRGKERVSASEGQ